MHLNKSYRYAAVYPSFIVIVVIAIYALIENRAYESEWLTGGAITLMTIAAVIAYCAIICFMTLPIFFNKIEAVRTNSILSALAWFVSPIIFIAITVSRDIGHNIKYDDEWSRNIIYTTILNVPYIISLIYSFYKFRQGLKNA